MREKIADVVVARLASDLEYMVYFNGGGKDIADSQNSTMCTRLNHHP
ncbi:MAG: hypothetical protein ABI167_07795 [Nitrosospira sp.]